jgi:hypothetical protein
LSGDEGELGRPSNLDGARARGRSNTDLEIENNGIVVTAFGRQMIDTDLLAL